MTGHLDIEISGEKLGLIFDNINPSLFRSVRRELRSYLINSSEELKTAHIIVPNNKKMYEWDSVTIDRFREFFLKVHRRYPATKNPEEEATLSVEALKCLDPDDDCVMSIIGSMERPEDLLFARMGSDLYFFHKTRLRGFFFLKQKTRFPIPAEWMHRVGIRKTDIALGVMNGLMFMLSYLLIHKDGLLLHGAAVKRDATAVLFLGQSGAGKSTISRLCSPDILYSDDGVIIRKEGKNLFTYPSPFNQSRSVPMSPPPEKGEIKKIYLIEKDSHNKVLKITKSELMNMILTQMIHYYKYLDDHSVKAGFHVTKEILDLVPAYRLRFAKKTKLWDDIK